jgi:glucans biosynthesis protein C
MINMTNGVTARADVPIKNRLYYLDWLRVITILAILCYHANRFFTLNDWSIKNAQRSMASTVFMEAFNLWMMPLLFMISGAAIYFSLKSRSTNAYLKERVLRLLVPLVIIGIFVLGAFQVYLERLTHGDFSGNFWQFYPHYFDGVYAFGGNFAFMGVHLWYLMLLFLFSLLAFPLMQPSQTSGKSLLARLSLRLNTSWIFVILFAAIGLGGLIADVLGLAFTREMGSWDMLSYFMFFLAGYMLFANPRTQDTVRRIGLPLLITGLVVSTIHLVLLFNSSIGQAYDDFPIDLRLVATWCLVLGILGTGSRFLSFNRKNLSYANEAVLPFYILHQPVLLAIGYFVVQWSLPIPIKYAIILIVSFIVIMAIYELLVRRWNVLRFLLGMKAKKKTATEPVAVVAEKE